MAQSVPAHMNKTHSHKTLKSDTSPVSNFSFNDPVMNANNPEYYPHIAILAILFMNAIISPVYFIGASKRYFNSDKNFVTFYTVVEFEENVSEADIIGMDGKLKKNVTTIPKIYKVREPIGYQVFMYSLMFISFLIMITAPIIYGTLMQLGYYNKMPKLMLGLIIIFAIAITSFWVSYIKFMNFTTLILASMADKYEQENDLSGTREQREQRRLEREAQEAQESGESGESDGLI